MLRETRAAGLVLPADLKEQHALLAAQSQGIRDMYTERTLRKQSSII
jgi:hypothetical protein